MLLGEDALEPEACSQERQRPSLDKPHDHTMMMMMRMICSGTEPLWISGTGFHRPDPFLSLNQNSVKLKAKDVYKT